MKIETAKRFIDTCYEAKHILSTRPPLEKGLTPAGVHMIDLVFQENQKGQGAKPSALSAELQLSRPGITRTLNQLEQLGMIEKRTDESDGRSVSIHLTAEGMRIYKKYVEEYYSYLAALLQEIPEEKMREAIHLFQLADQLVTAHPMQQEKEKEGSVHEQ